MTLTWCRLTIEIFVRIVRTVIEIIEKSPENRFFGLFGAAFSYVSQFPAVRFCYHCTYRNLLWCEMNVDTFVQLDLTVFFYFLVTSGLLLVMFLKSQPCNLVAIAYIGIWYGVK